MATKRKPLLRVVKRPGLRSTLTPELHQELIRVHLENGDFAAATAITCGVKPKTLDKWIRRGQEDDAPEFLQAFSLEFLQAETAVRAELLWQLRNADNHHTVNALTWILQKRFRQYNKADEASNDALDMLNADGPKAGLSPEQKRLIIEQMLRKPTEPVRELLAAAGYVRAEPEPQEKPNAEEDRPDFTH